MISYIILVVLVMVLIFIFSRFYPTATGKITENLYAVRSIFVSFYVLQTSGGTVLFDAGMNAATAKRGLKKLGISPESVTHVFLTHSDYDHVGGLAAFRQAARYIPKAEVPMIDGTLARRGFMRNHFKYEYRTLENEETITVGESAIQLLNTPGHTAGSASFLIDGKYLMTGDLLRLSRKGVILPFLPLMNMNHKQDIKSIETLRTKIEKIEYIFTAHTGYQNENNIIKS